MNKLAVGDAYNINMGPIFKYFEHLNSKRKVSRESGNTNLLRPPEQKIMFKRRHVFFCSMNLEQLDINPGQNACKENENNKTIQCYAMVEESAQVGLEYFYRPLKNPMNNIYLNQSVAFETPE